MVLSPKYVIAKETYRKCVVSPGRHFLNILEYVV